MEYKNISKYAELLLQIKQLKEDKRVQEEELKQKFNEFANSFKPISIVKSSLHNLITDKVVQHDLMKIALNFGTNILISKIFGKRNNIINFIGIILAKKLSKSFINNNLQKIMEYLSGLIYTPTEKVSESNSK